MHSRLVGAAVLAVVLQLCLLPLFPWLHALLAPMHALCCCATITLLHPGVAAARDRIVRLAGHNPHISLEVLALDPVVLAALQMPPPGPPFGWTVIALLLAAAGHITSCLSHLHESTAPATEAASHCLIAAGAACIILATRPIRVMLSRTMEAFLGVVALVAAVMLHGHEPLGAVLRAGWPQTGYLTCAVLRSLSLCALTMQSLSGLVGAMAPDMLAPPTRSSRSAFDVLRWGAQASGSLLLLAPCVVRHLLSANVVPDVSILAVGCSHLGMSSFTLSAWLAHVPPLLIEDEACMDRLDEATAAKAGFSSVDQMKAARRAARRAHLQGEMPPPLLLDSLHRTWLTGSISCTPACGAARRKTRSDSSAPKKSSAYSPKHVVVQPYTSCTRGCLL